jgi:hypothetical protein
VRTAGAVLAIFELFQQFIGFFLAEPVMRFDGRFAGDGGNRVMLDHGDLIHGGTANR